jgi:asparagine synthase (glutamine-hydrolysing)
VCGIAGAIDLERGLAPAAELAGGMADVLAHRGPDDAGCLVDGPVALAHRRLAIIDLSPGGHQPMASRDERAWLVFNGEIYNYRELRAELEVAGHTFRSSSDTEVLIAAYTEWHTGMLDRLNGMFAFAIWDRERGTALLVRDRFGVKPLYYTVAGGRFRFASEIKALLADPDVVRRPNDPRVLEFLAYGVADHSSETMFAGVSQIPPGSYLEVKPYEPPGPPVTWYGLKARKRGSEPPAAALRQRLDQAVAFRLRSDVPVGVSLSGGMDSSSVLAVAASLRRAEGMKAPASFSATTSDPNMDESRFAAEVVACTGGTNETVLPQFEGLVAELDSLIWHMDEPFHSPSVYGQRKVDELARANGMKVILDGQGGDEVLSGYHHFHYPALLCSLLMRGKVITFVREIRARQRQVGEPPVRSLKDVIRLFHGRRRRTAGRPDWLSPAAAVPDRPTARPSLSAHQDFGMRIYPLPAYNHHCDRNSMTFSLESRNPLLDVDFVETARSLRPEELLHDGYTKWALREAVRDIVPASVVDRARKQGFTTDEALWVREAGLREDFRRVFSSRSFAGRGYFDPQRAIEALEEHARGGSRASDLWRAYVVERWLRLFIDPEHLTAPSPPETAIPSAGSALDKLQVLGDGARNRVLEQPVG